MASRDLAHRRTTFSPVRWIFSVSWSTAMLDGAHTSTGPEPSFARWYTIVADVTVFPVPGGPWISVNGRCTQYPNHSVRHYNQVCWALY